MMFKDSSIKEAWCDSDDNCTRGAIFTRGNGAQTGRCIKTNNQAKGICEIFSWCPLENGSTLFGRNSYLFPMVHNYTLLIKNDINFPKFNVRRRNIQSWASNKFLSECLYNKSHPENKHCPIFKFSTIFKEADVDDSIFVKGGVIEIDISWKCDLDWNERYCNPTYSFSRLDDAKAQIAAGFNFRYANFYRINDTDYRDLIKAFGIRFIVNAHGVAGKFHILPFTMNIGSGLGLLGLASIICDMIVLRLLPSRHIYHRAKFEMITKEQVKSAKHLAHENQIEESKGTNDNEIKKQTKHSRA